MAGKGGGAWKVAYADFVTAMMAFFMVMWLTAQKPEVKQAIAGYFRSDFAIFQGNEPGNAVDATPTQDPKLGHPVKPAPRRVPNSGDDTNYHFPVYFSGDTAELDAKASEDIHSFTPFIVGKMNRVEVRAHCQRQPLAEGGQFQDPLDLCYSRARAVRKELEAQGVDGDRIRLSQAGSSEPMAANLTSEEMDLNSRVDVILLPDLVDTPWHDSHAPDAEAPGEPIPEPLPTTPIGGAREGAGSPAEEFHEEETHAGDAGH